MYSHLYSACVYDERGEYENAMRDYKTAFTLAENIHDSLYMWRISQYIGDLFYNQLYFDDALKIYKSSIIWINNNEHKALCYADIACIYHMKGISDSVFCYIRQAIDLAEQANDKMVLSQIYQNAHVYCRENNESKLAKKYLKMAYEIHADPLLENQYNLNLLTLCLDDMDMSSANIYVNKLKNKYDIIEDGTMKISICSEFVKYYSMMNMCDSVIYYQNEMALTSQKIYEQYMYQNIYEIQQKYDNELQRNVYQKKLNKRLYIILCILTVLFLVSMISFIIITNSKRREKDLSKRVDNLNSEKKDYDKFKYEIKESLNNSLKERIKIIKEVNDFEHNNRTNKNVKEIKQYAYGSPFKTAFEASEDVIESSYGDITSFIKKTFPELNETEYKVCLLSVVPISVDDIANIIELGVDSVGKARTNIRKKMKIENKRASFSEYILEKYYQRED
jgi:DNA-binding CsgD family transcriptional regulator